MKTKKILIFALLAGFLSTGFSYGQQAQVADIEFDRFSIGIEMGLFTPFGDVKEWRYLPKPADELSFGGGFNVSYFITPALSFRGQFSLGSLRGIDSEERFRFESNFLEGNLQGIVSLNKLLVPLWEGNNHVDLYTGVGVGFVGYRSLLYLNNVLHHQIGYSAGGTVKEPRYYDMTIPLSLGIRYNVSPRIDVFVESSFRFSRTDRIDGLIRPFTRNDAYNFTSAGVAIKLGAARRPISWEPPAAVMYPGDVARMDELSNRLGVVERRVAEVDRAAAVDAHGRELKDLRSQMQAMEKRQDEMNQNLTTLMERKVEEYKPSVAALLNVYFRLNSAEIDNFNYERIASAARFLTVNPNMRLEIIGHTDISGPAAFNTALSERRARAVYNVLVNDFNIEPARLEVSFKGEDKPFADPRLRINRRVEFRVIE